ncbi:hypothetical protein [Paenibacillus sp. GbtcB18]|uniref:hypothetical protein n=1 Tax=Paenibacillus sp. GbtcB18 TaxID=2824763 RepID=UPI001C2FBEDB|nr:hypothetical protein [Paenibacillus sp. GbtcB18]
MRKRISRREFIGNADPEIHISGGRLYLPRTDKYRKTGKPENRKPVKIKSRLSVAQAAQKGAGS